MRRDSPFVIIATASSIDVDEIGKRGKQSGVGEHFGLDAVVQRLFPSIEDVSERRLLMRSAFRASRHLPYRPQL